MKRVKLAIVVPTYNEADNLPKLVTQVKSTLKDAKAITHCTLLVIDDNSPDGTGKVADKLAKKHSTGSFRLAVLHREHKEGLGKAYVAGISEALKLNITHILQMDADLSHSPSYISNLVKAAESADLVIGSRYIQGGATPDWNAWRQLQSRLGNLYARAFLGNKIHDYTGGFNLYSTALLKQLDLSTLHAPGYGFQIELKYRALQTGATSIEVPIVFVDRVKGKSKIPKTTLVSTLLLVPKLRFIR